MGSGLTSLSGPSRGGISWGGIGCLCWWTLRICGSLIPSDISDLGSRESERGKGLRGQEVDSGHLDGGDPSDVPFCYT